MTKPANMAFAYFPPDYHTNHPYVVGRHVATENFFKAYIRYANPEPLFCYCPVKPHYEEFVQQVAAITGSDKLTEWISIAATPNLAKVGCLFNTDPRLAELAWLRRHSNPRGFSLIGVVHTLVERSILDGVGELVTAPVESWDAVVCTSRAGRTYMTQILEGYRDYLSSRFGQSLPASPLQLPIIPLGVDCMAYARTPTRLAAAQSLRQQHGIGESDIVALFLGRISYLDKAHPQPMYLGLEAAAKQTGKRIHLLHVGQFSHAGIEQHFKQAAQAFCPSVNALFIDSKKTENRAAAWAAADFFTSLADNIQETFGLTPIEAMAAGLPLVVSDWDGYQDTVTPDVGFRAPVIIPPPGPGMELMLSYDLGGFDYGRYIGSVSQCTAVDIAACRDAYAALIVNADLRRQMGEAARRRAETHYDWTRVISQYQELITELNNRRQSDAESCPRQSGAQINPLRPDPFWLYAGFASASLKGNNLIELATPLAVSLDEVLRHPMNATSPRVFLPTEELHHLLNELAEKGSQRISDIVAAAPPAQRFYLLRSIAWLLKMGLVRLASGLP